MERIDTLDAMERLAALETVPIFTGLDASDLQSIGAAVVERRFDPGEVVVAQGEVGDEMFVIVEGSAVVSRSAAGAREFVVELRPGDLVGELAVLRRAERIADVHAGAQGMLGLVIGRDTLQVILQDRPQIALAMLATLADTLATASGAPG